MKLYWKFLTSCAALTMMGMSDVRAGAFTNICHNCNYSAIHACAARSALDYGLPSNSVVWILDTGNLNPYKFQVEIQTPGTIIRGEPDDEGVNSSVAIPTPLSLSNVEQLDMQALLAWIDELIYPNGGQPSRECSGSQLNLVSGLAEESAINQASGGSVVFPIAIPENSGFGSAYDVIGCGACSVQLNSVFSGLSPVLDYASRVANVVNNVLSMPVDTSVQLLVFFADGTSAVWNYNHVRTRWDADPDSFEDSEGNPIPLVRQDMEGRIYQFQDSDGNNLHRFLQRAVSFGIPIDGPDGGSCPVVCRVEDDGPTYRLICHLAC